MKVEKGPTFIFIFFAIWVISCCENTFDCLISASFLSCSMKYFVYFGTDISPRLDRSIIFFPFFIRPVKFEVTPSITSKSDSCIIWMTSRASDRSTLNLHSSLALACDILIRDSNYLIVIGIILFSS